MVDCYDPTDEFDFEDDHADAEGYAIPAAGIRTDESGIVEIGTEVLIDNGIHPEQDELDDFSRILRSRIKSRGQASLTEFEEAIDEAGIPPETRRDALDDLRKKGYTHGGN